jgi:outer membrane protein OmpA-like peptidoglycan-associated protein
MEPNMSQKIDRTAARRTHRRRSVMGVLTAALLLSGCASVPDWVDPTDWFASDPAPARVGLTQGQAASQPTAFPNLASVPNQPPKVLSLESRSVVQANLAADRANAVYSGEKLTGSAPANSTQTATAQAISDAPPAPKISGQLISTARVPPAPVQTQAVQTQVPQPPVTQPQIAQAPAAPPQVAQAAGGQTQLRFPQFQNAPIQAALPMAAAPVATGAQLVAVIYFAHSSSQLDGKDRAVLRGVVALQDQRGGTIRAIGHASAHTAVTDQIDHDLNNFEMSLKRANSVSAALIALGADRDRVRAEARSDKQPVYHEFMTTGQAGNRRVEIFLEN